MTDTEPKTRRILQSLFSGLDLENSEAEGSSAETEIAPNPLLNNQTIDLTSEDLIEEVIDFEDEDAYPTWDFSNIPTPLEGIDILRQHALFSDVSDESLKALSQQTQEQHFAANTQLIHKGEVGECMYILLDGQVRLSMLDKATRETHTLLLGPGQLFGEIALLAGVPRSADVFAHTDIRCLRINKTDVEQLIKAHIDLASMLTTLLGERLVASGELQRVGAYQLLSELGRGGMATVYAGVHATKPLFVAIKMLSHELVYQGSFADDFRREAKVLSTLRHPHIVDFIDSEEAYATFFIVMEKLSGVDLNRRIQHEGPFDYDLTRSILRQLASALAYAHDHGIIHRDIKPSNIMFAGDGKVKLTDFGLATHLHVLQAITPKNRPLAGTPVYMAPELILRKPIDHRIDIYALGIVAYKMLAGKPPFVGKLREVLFHHVETPLPSILDIDPDIPQDIVDFIERATQKDPNARFQSAHEILDLFDKATPQEAIPEMTRITLTYPSRRKNLVQQAVAALKEQLGDKVDLIIE